MMFQRVDPQQAGPNAIGVLVPVGKKTLVIVRPRALAFDLLPARWDGDAWHAPMFCSFTRDEAAIVARGFITSLEAAADCPVQTFGAAGASQVWVRAGEFVWIVCRRAPGQAYQPTMFASAEEAMCEAERLSALVWPAADAVQEYYFNTQNLA